METYEVLRALARADGLSGHEEGIGREVEGVWAPLCDEVRTDRMGSVYALKRPTKPSAEGCRVPRVLFMAHADEIGLIVTRVERGGFLRFSSVGGIDARTLPGQEVVIHGREAVVGVIGAKPPHLSSLAERKRPILMRDMYIDTGLSEAACGERVGVGDPVALRRDLMRLRGQVVSGKALDDRAGLTAVTRALQLLDSLRFPAEVLAVASVQEETSYLGAFTSTYAARPDVAVVVDVCHAEMPGSPEDRSHPMGKAPVLALGPQIHPRVLQALRDAAAGAGVECRSEVSVKPGGTDAFAVQVAREGVPTGIVSMPLRYMHTSVETGSLADVESCGRLLAHFAASVDGNFVEGLSCF